MKIWTPNQQLKNGRFIIQKPLGGGGYGATYLAKEQTTNKLFVIKTLNEKQQEKPDFPERQEKFVNEAMRLAKCNHPHIVQVFELIQEDGLWGMVMEYVQGEDLEAYINDNGVLSEVEALRYIDQVGQALEYVHAQGFLHRDVKPNNIILRRETKEAVLIDFGLAREFNLSEKRSMTGTKTEGYAPIEQYDRKGNFGYYTDVYALAATLYSLLTGKVPIPAHYRLDDIPLPSPKAKYNPQISDRVNAAILKGMELEAEKRPQTVREFREILGLVQEDVELKSAVGMDYRKLRDFLKAGKWEEADEETRRVMLAVTKREEEYWLDVEDIDNFPCEDLRTIDQLWVKYSNGKFGFSVQKRIYQSLGGTREYNREIWEALWDAVGWGGEDYLYYSITFDIRAPKGHLPYLCFSLFFLGSGVGSGLFSRIETCSLSNKKPKIQHFNLVQLNEIELTLSTGIDYRKLRDLLAAGKWQEADEETRRVMLAVAKREKPGWSDVQSIDNFPCEDLRTIDQLWVKYSNGKFGFSVQKQIYQSLGGTREYNDEIWEAFGEAVGWKKGGSWLWLSYSDIIFDTRAPKGHLPLQDLGFDGCLASILFSRVEICELLKSAVGMDYRKLRDLLAAGEWREANEETVRVMLVVGTQKQEGWLDVKHINNFSCEDLRTIDQLWVKYSNGKFGFSVQKQIYQSLGGTREYNHEIWEAFGDTVGWREGGNWLWYSQIIFDIKSLQGHLPAFLGRNVPFGSCGAESGFGWVRIVSSLASRLVDCNI